MSIMDSILADLTVPACGRVMTTDRGEVVLFVHKPRTLAPIPYIDPARLDPKMFIIRDEAYCQKWFNEILDTKADICGVNGMRINLNEYLWCNYCKAKMNVDGYYCYHCHNAMCHLCHAETSEEVAIANGAKNYKERAEKLATCRSLGQIKPRLYLKWTDLDSFSNDENGKYGRHGCPRCKKCDNFVEQYEHGVVFWSKRKGHIRAPLPTDTEEERAKLEVMCDRCGGEPPFKRRKFDYKTAPDECFPYSQSGDFGSLLDWVPVIEDILNYGEVTVMVNLNPDRPNFGQVALSTLDDHGRIGFFALYNETLDSLLDKMNSMTPPTGEDEEMDDYDKEHWTPLSQLVKDLDLDFYYG
jgi:hypothetical protein